MVIYDLSSVRVSEVTTRVPDQEAPTILISGSFQRQNYLTHLGSFVEASKCGTPFLVRG